MNILITNARIVDPSQGIDSEGWVLVQDGVIAGMDAEGRTAPPVNSVAVAGCMTFDARGLYLFPGLVDMHCHLREPGFEYKETIKSGTRAAAAGGFTSVCCMPNTKPVNDNETVTEFIIRKALSEGVCDVFPIGSITKRQEGAELAEMGMMKDAGCVAFSDDGRPVESALMMRHALEYAAGFDVPVVSHAEDLNLSLGGVMNEGRLSTMLGLGGIPSESEIIMIKRDIELAALTGGRLHIAHVSTAGGVAAIREAKRTGINVTAETCPHYFSATEDAVAGYNTYAKVNPPLRTVKDVEAIKAGLADDTIDAVATDHAPHHKDDKLCEFDKAAFGISGFETALPLALRLVEEGVLTLSRLVEKMTIVPSRIFGLNKGTLNKGTLKKGADADIVLVDMKRSFTVDGDKFVSKGKNTPFNGMELFGLPVMTIRRGIIVHDVREGRV